MATPEEPRIVVYFWLPRDQTRYEGLAFDQLSSTGIWFATKRDLTMRQKMKVCICVCLPGSKEGKCTPPVPAEVTQIEKRDNLWHIFAQFMDETHSKDISGEDRREQTRHPVTLEGDYCTVHGMPPHKCKVIDISKSGAGFITDQGLKIGKHITFRIFSVDGGLDKIMIDATVEIRRSQHKGSGVYEIGVLFLHHHAHEDIAKAEERATEEEKTTQEDEAAPRETAELSEGQS